MKLFNTLLQQYVCNSVSSHCMGVHRPIDNDNDNDNTFIEPKYSLQMRIYI